LKEIISIACKTPSVNALYGTFIIPSKNGKRPNIIRGMKTDAKHLKKEVENKLFTLDTSKFDKFKEKKLFVTLAVHGNWYNKDKTVKKKDLANYEKFITDTVFEYLGLKDQFVFEYYMLKVQSDTEGFVLQIEDLKEEI